MRCEHRTAGTFCIINFIYLIFNIAAISSLCQDETLTMLESTAQYAGTNLQGCSVILDAKCVLGSGRKVDIEVQKRNDDDHQRRVRYNGAILTTNLTDPGEKFEFHREAGMMP